MASNLSAIGFGFAGPDDFQKQMIARAAEASERIGCAAGDYSIWRSTTGAEIWFHIPPFGTDDDARDIAGLTPFFEGTSEVALEIVERITRPDDNAFEGALRGNVGGPDGYPLVFEAADFAAHLDRVLPFRCRACIVAFAKMVRAHASEAAYAGVHDGRDGLPLSSRAFVPIGSFEAASESQPPPPVSEALFTGRVAEHHALINEATGRVFHWLLVETLDATFDVVADPETIEGDIAENGIVEIGATMFGRLLGE